MQLIRLPEIVFFPGVEIVSEIPGKCESNTASSLRFPEMFLAVFCCLCKFVIRTSCRSVYTGHSPTSPDTFACMWYL